MVVVVEAAAETTATMIRHHRIVLALLRARRTQHTALVQVKPGGPGSGLVPQQVVRQAMRWAIVIKRATTRQRKLDRRIGSVEVAVAEEEAMALRHRAVAGTRVLALVGQGDDSRLARRLQRLRLSKSYHSRLHHQ